MQLLLERSSDLDIDTFQVYAQLDLPFPHGRIRLHVIGASSLVLVERSGVSLLEAITCETPKVRRGLVEVCVARALGACGSLARAEDAFSYRGRLWSVPLGDAPFPNALPSVLEHRFPGPGEPVTRIEAEPDGSSLRIRTRHDYPESGVAVWSESHWTFRP